MQASLLLHFNEQATITVEHLRINLLKDTLLDDEIFALYVEPLIKEGVLEWTDDSKIKMRVKDEK